MNCLLRSYAICLNVNPEVLVEEIGHDGSAIIWPDFAEPYSRRAFHIAEFIEPCLKRGFVPLNIEAIPLLAVANRVHPIELKLSILSYTKQFEGILIGEYISNRPHAVAWDKRFCIDPNGLIYPIENFSIREFVALIRKI